VSQGASRLAQQNPRGRDHGWRCWARATRATTDC